MLTFEFLKQYLCTITPLFFLKTNPREDIHSRKANEDTHFI